MDSESESNDGSGSTAGQHNLALLLIVCKCFIGNGLGCRDSGLQFRVQVVGGNSGIKVECEPRL